MRQSYSWLIEVNTASGFMTRFRVVADDAVTAVAIAKAGFPNDGWQPQAHERAVGQQMTPFTVRVIGHPNAVYIKD